MVKCSVQGCNNPAVVEIEGKPLCKVHAAAIKGKLPRKIDRDSLLETIHPQLIFERDPLTSFIQAVEGFREAYLPLPITYRRIEEATPKEVSEKKGESKEIDWNTLVGAEPIDELKHDIDLVLAAELAEREGAVTTSMLAKYLNQHPYSQRKDYNEDRARALLDKLAELKIVKKKSRAGKRGQNIYDYYEGERSWRKS